MSGNKLFDVGILITKSVFFKRYSSFEINTLLNRFFYAMNLLPVGLYRTVMNKILCINAWRSCVHNEAFSYSAHKAVINSWQKPNA